MKIIHLVAYLYELFLYKYRGLLQFLVRDCNKSISRVVKLFPTEDDPEGLLESLEPPTTGFNRCDLCDGPTDDAGLTIFVWADSEGC